MIERSEADGIVTLRLAHGKASALDLELLQGLSTALDEAQHATTRAVILTGTGSIFSAGVDLFRILKERDAYIDRFVPALTTTFRKLFDFPRPLVAAINGHAIAGGCILANACDYRLMASGRGRIGIPELHVGVPFPPFALELMRLVISPSHLQEIVYGGATYSPDEALRRGLLDEVTAAEDLDSRAAEKAAQLAQIDPVVFAITKRQLRASALRAYEALGATADDEVNGRWRSPEALSRIEAYLEKTVGRKA